MTEKRRNTLLILAVMLLVLAYTFSGRSIGISLDFGDNTLTVKVKDYTAAIDYHDIGSLQLVAYPEPGTATDGTASGQLRYGTFQNEIWGTYRQCTTSKAENCILITMHDGSIFVLNYQDSETTSALYEMFSELLASKNSP